MVGLRVGRQPDWVGDQGQASCFSVAQGPQARKEKKKGEAKAEASAAVGETQVGERSKVRVSGPPCLPRINAPIASPRQAAAPTLELGQALVEASLLRSPALLMWLPAAACGRPNPCAQGSGDFPTGEKMT